MHDSLHDVVGDLDEFDELADEIEKSVGLMSGVSAPAFVDHTADPEAIPQRSMIVSEANRTRIRSYPILVDSD